MDAQKNFEDSLEGGLWLAEEKELEWGLETVTAAGKVADE